MLCWFSPFWSLTAHCMKSYFMEILNFTMAIIYFIYLFFVNCFFKHFLTVSPLSFSVPLNVMKDAVCAFGILEACALPSALHSRHRESCCAGVKIGIRSVGFKRASFLKHIAGTFQQKCYLSSFISVSNWEKGGSY